MSISERVTLEECLIWSEMVDTFFKLTGDDPNDKEHREILDMARTFVPGSRACFGDAIEGGPN